jgi:Acetyltransferase (GNAT) family
MTVVIANGDRDNARDAFYWHRGFSAANEGHLFPRTWGHYMDLADNYQLVCAREGDDYLGLCYYADDDGRWEIGGLMVAANQRGRALGSILMRVTLGNLLIDIDPLANGSTVISHVHADNNAPRRVITDRLKFAHRKRIEVPGHRLPGLKTNAEGMVVGDEFELTKDSLLVLADWCESWDDRLLDGTPARIELRESLTLGQWSEAFKEMAENHF